MITVEHLVKHYKVHARPPGVLSALRSLVRRPTTTVRAVDDISFTIKAGEAGMDALVMVGRDDPLDLGDDAIRGWFAGLPAQRPVQTTLPGGSIFRVIEFAPGVASRNHRTDTIDYIVCMQGEIDMDIDGANVHLKAGDVMVQRGTIHNWINNGKESCILAVILIDAKSVKTENGKVLDAAG